MFSVPGVNLLPYESRIVSILDKMVLINTKVKKMSQPFKNTSSLPMIELKIILIMFLMFRKEQS